MFSPEQLAELVVRAIETATAPLHARISALERAHPSRDGIDGKDGKDAVVDVAAVASQVFGMFDVRDEQTQTDLDRLKGQVQVIGDRLLEIATLPAPKDGRDADPEMVKQAVAAAFAQIPQPSDGHSVTVEDVAPLIADEVSRAVAAIPPPKDGRDADPDVLRRSVADEVSLAIASIPKPADGTSVTVADVAPLIGDEIRKAVAALPIAKDGAGIQAALIDRAGHLILTMTDGRAENVGPVVGASVEPAAVKQMCEDLIAALPKPKDGTNGRDGQDGNHGLGFEDMDFEFDEKGHLFLVFKRGDLVKRAMVPGRVHQGTYRPESEYVAGDNVTFDGSEWCALKSGTLGRPGTTDSGWRLTVKRGSDGKTGARGPEGKQGPQGIRGNDGRNGY